MSYCVTVWQWHSGSRVYYLSNSKSNAHRIGKIWWMHELGLTENYKYKYNTHLLKCSSTSSTTPTPNHIPIIIMYTNNVYSSTAWWMLSFKMIFREKKICHCQKVLFAKKRNFTKIRLSSLTQSQKVVQSVQQVNNPEAKLRSPVDTSRWRALALRTARPIKQFKNIHFPRTRFLRNWFPTNSFFHRNLFPRKMQGNRSKLELPPLHYQ